MNVPRGIIEVTVTVCINAFLRGHALLRISMLWKEDALLRGTASVLTTGHGNITVCTIVRELTHPDFSDRLYWSRIKHIAVAIVSPEKHLRVDLP